MTVDLYLWGTPPATPGPVDLYLGGSATPPPPDRAVEIGGTLPGLAGYVSMAAGMAVAIGGTMPGLTVAIDIAVDLGLPETAGAGTGGRWRTARAAGSDVRPAWQPRPATLGGAVAGWSDAAPCAADQAGSWRATDATSGAVASGWREAAAGSGHARAAWNGRPVSLGAAGAHWRSAGSAAGAALTGWHALAIFRADCLSGWRAAGMAGIDLPNDWTRAAECEGARAERWRTAGVPDTASSRPQPPIVPPGPQPRPPQGGALELWLCRPADLSDSYSVALWLGRPPCQRVPAIPARRVYYVTASFSLVRASDGAEIPCAGMVYEADIDTGIIRCSATLLGAGTAALLEPLVGDEPVELVGMINGIEYRWLADGWTEDIRHGRSARSLTGYSFGVELDSPYQLPVDRTNPAPATLAQLAAAELPIGSGWAVDSWTAPDWTVPAGCWTLAQATPLAAITRLAVAASGVVVPSRTARSLRIVPRDAAAPWDYAGATPALSIPHGAGVTVLGRRSTRPAQADAVYIGGGEAAGLLARVRRAGSAGSLVAPTVLDPLLTDAEGLRARGVRELAARWRQPAIASFELPIGGPDFPLLELTQLVDVAGVRGVVSAVRVSVEPVADAYRVRQRVALGEDSGNLARRWRALTAADPLLVGTVTAGAGTDGRVTVALLGGGTVRPRGAAEVGAHVYVRSDELAGEAPAFGAAMDIEV